MKLYRHYKNKPYTYLGVAKHSETLEDLVLYETRYENNLAKLWVRPKEMFFSSVTSGGIEQPRFREIPLHISSATEVTDAMKSEIGRVMAEAFGQWDPTWFESTFRNHQKFYLLTARIDDEVVGFKLGYELNGREFYSWLGGVLPKYRGLGIAADLMRAQHDWCRDQGYQRVQTKTQNRFREMLLLNLRFGFEITGLLGSDEGGPKIVLEKELGRSELRS